MSLCIFEGPDGSGKSTAAGFVARATRSVLIHHGAHPDATEDTLAGKYAASMTNALVGGNVVLDRAWLSEPIYGTVMRDGVDRVGSRAATLDELAMWCGGVMVLCRPPFEACAAAYRARRALEYLPDEARLRAVYDMYCHVRTHLRVITYDHTTRPLETLMEEITHG